MGKKISSSTFSPEVTTHISAYGRVAWKVFVPTQVEYADFLGSRPEAALKAPMMQASDKGVGVVAEIRKFAVTVGAGHPTKSAIRIIGR
ncbi:MAG: hypothetical protein Q8L48_11115 [Archangium sp.]|nr:hypothetical protein [Archangium sp.]